MGWPNYDLIELEKVKKERRKLEIRNARLEGRDEERFIQKKEAEKLSQARQDGLTTGFIDTLIIGRDITPINEFEGIEYETKLAVHVSEEKNPHNYLYSVVSSFPDGNYIKNGPVLKKQAENFYYGKDTLVIMKQPKIPNSCLKYKENISQIGHVLKRKDFVVKNCSDEDVFKEIQRVILEGAQYVGRIFRDRARTDFLSEKSGRIYTLFFDVCDVFPVEKKQFVKKQLEVEYMGFIPNYSGGYTSSEAQIIEELLELTDIIAKITDTAYTRETKSDFLK